MQSRFASLCDNIETMTGVMVLCVLGVFFIPETLEKTF